MSNLAVLVQELVIPPDPDPPAEVGERPGLLETRLPDKYHKAYSLKLSGVPVQEIAERLQIDRVTVWRHCRAVEKEYTDFLERTPAFNVASLQYKKLCDLEELNRQSAMACKSERAKVGFLQNAMKAVAEQNKLLLDCGVLRRAPSELFKIVADMRPVDLQTEQHKRDGRSREQILGELLEKLSRAGRF